MDTDTDNDAIFNVSMMKSVRIEIPGNGTVEPGLTKNGSTSDRAKTNAGNRRNKCELEAILKKKVNSLLHRLHEIEEKTDDEAKKEFHFAVRGPNEVEDTMLKFYDSNASITLEHDRIQTYRKYRQRLTQQRAKKLLEKEMHQGKIR